MSRGELSKRNRSVAALLGAGAIDTHVCRELGLTPAQFERTVQRIAAFVAETADLTHPMALCERALRCRADGKRRSIAARFRALMETASEAVLVVDGRSGVIREANDRAAGLFGRSRLELVGLSVEELVPDSIRSIHAAYRLGFLASSRRREMGHHPGIVAVRPDESRSELAIALTATNNDDDVMVVCTEYSRWAVSEVESRSRATVE